MRGRMMGNLFVPTTRLSVNDDGFGLRDSYATVGHHGLDVAGVIMGLVAGIFLGLNGMEWQASADGLGNSLSVFFVCQFGVTLVLLVPLFLKIPSMRKADHGRIAAPFAFAGAVCFCIAQTGQAMAILDLGEAIGMPLTQLNLIVAGLWGICFYKETTAPRMIAIFFFAILIDIAGAILISH